MCYLAISLSGFLIIFAARTRGFCFSRRPGPQLGLAAVFALIMSTIISFTPFGPGKRWQQWSPSAETGRDKRGTNHCCYCFSGPSCKSSSPLERPMGRRKRGGTFSVSYSFSSMMTQEHEIGIVSFPIPL